MKNCNQASVLRLLSEFDAGEAPLLETVEGGSVRRKASSTVTIAVLDDRPTIAEICARTLRAHGFLVDAFTTPDELLRQMAVTRYDAFVIDWLLEDVTAEDLIAELRSRPQGQSSPIFLLSANGWMGGELLDERMRSSIARWHLQYRAKPYSPKQLAVEIAASLS